MELVLFRNGIWDMLRTINEDIEQVFRPLADAHRLTMIQMRLLIELYRGGDHTIGSLAKAVSLTGGNASAMCKRLEKEGYLTRVRGTSDERVVNLRLTEQGERTVSEIEDTLEKRFGPLMKQKQTDELTVIYEGFRRLALILEEMKTLT